MKWQDFWPKLYGRANCKTSYWVTRYFYLRGLGALYFIAATILFFQGPGLIGPHGLAPIQNTTASMLERFGSMLELQKNFPSLLWISAEDSTLYIMAGVMGLGSAFMVLGFCNWIILIVMWICQLSLVNSAWPFYGFGWETMLLEMTFFSLFLCHPWRWSLKRVRQPTISYFSIFPLYWMLFRLMFGAGLIKIRGDECWLNLTCMDVHYQTQPNPHFLSWFYHQMPWWFHRFEVGFTHFVELLVPFGFLLMAKVRWISVLITILFQLVLISTGNLAFINWQTIVLCLIGLDDRFWHWILQKKYLDPNLSKESSSTHSLCNKALPAIAMLIVLSLSYRPLMNMISPGQRMNESYDPFHLVNSYGLFGSITKKRFEVVVEGTLDEKVSDQTVWLAYEFPCKPGDVNRRPCWITPYHLRLDWQMWFSAMRPRLQEPWLLKLGEKLLQNEARVLSLMSHNPFPDQPPKWVRMELYLYEWAPSGSKNWWQRQRVGEYLPPIRLR
ncbi:MAG: lipase maturation factor family protein [Bdellovibrionales bacterium]|nr:lipase maturation factor family protein [Bdellovibrionales bacterium]